MKALVYNGPRDVRVKNVKDAKIERPTDVLVRITSSNICGSDLHMYEGRTDMEEGKVLGHENLGQVVEVGEAVDRIKVGDWVCLPFNVACGFCKNCEARSDWGVPYHQSWNGRRGLRFRRHGALQRRTS